MPIIKIKEHKNIFHKDKFKKKFFDAENEKWQEIKGCELFENNKYKDNKEKETIPEAFFIGLDWLDEKNALFVKPKIENLDFLKMFVVKSIKKGATKKFIKSIPIKNLQK